MKKKILIIDDDPCVIKLVGIKLRDWGYEVISSMDGIECFQLIDKEMPDLVLLDIMMPGFDGLSICSKLTLNYKMPVIMLSALDDAATRNYSSSLGASEYVSKPIHSKELQSKIEKFIGTG